MSYESQYTDAGWSNAEAWAFLEIAWGWQGVDEDNQ
jgi:hypothetical protein